MFLRHKKDLDLKDHLEIYITTSFEINECTSFHAHEIQARYQSAWTSVEIENQRLLSSLCFCVFISCKVPPQGRAGIMCQQPEQGDCK